MPEILSMLISTRLFLPSLSSTPALYPLILIPCPIASTQSVKMADFNSVARQFVEFYYNTFDTNRSQLAGLYRDHSMLTFETESILGSVRIVEKLNALPFQKVAHKVNTLDAQPSNENGGILVVVTGALLVDEEQRPMNYTQTFQLLPDSGSYFVFNDFFRLVYG